MKEKILFYWDMLVLWFHSKKKLVDGIIYLHEHLCKTLQMFESAKTLEELKQWREQGAEGLRIGVGSDLGQGELNLHHWSARILADSFGNLLEEYKAQNYVSTIFRSPRWYSEYEVTVRRVNGLTPTQKATQLELRVKELEAELGLLKGEQKGELHGRTQDELSSQQDAGNSQVESCSTRCDVQGSEQELHPGSQEGAGGQAESPASGQENHSQQ